MTGSAPVGFLLVPFKSPIEQRSKPIDGCVYRNDSRVLYKPENNPCNQVVELLSKMANQSRHWALLNCQYLKDNYCLCASPDVFAGGMSMNPMPMAGS